MRFHVHWYKISYSFEKKLTASTYRMHNPADVIVNSDGEI